MLISVLIFAGCLFFSFAGGFNLIEVQYYTPRVIGNINDRLEKIKSGYGDYFTNLDRQLREFLSEQSVSSYIEREPSPENMEKRDTLCSLLFQKNPGLEGIRLVENDGVHIHYSTFSDDILSETAELVTYSNYMDRIPYALIEASDGDKKTLVYFDNTRNRLLFSYPFYDAYTAYRGTIVFYVSGDDFTRSLINRDIVSLNARGTVLSPAGFVFGLPLTGRKALIQEIQERWGKRYSNIEQIAESDDKRENLFVISTTDESGIKIGWICSQDEFEFSDMEKIALLVCLFITLFLVVFLMFNLRHDDMVFIKRRIRKFQYELLKEYIERKDTTDWKTLAKGIASRRMDVNDEVKKSLGRRGKKHSEVVDAMLESSWQDIMSAFASASSRNMVPKQFESREPLVEEIPSPVKASMPEKIPEAEPVEAPEEIQELEEVEEAEPVEELEEVPEAEAVEELEEVEEAEPVEELEEVPEAEAVEELEEVEEAEPVEELEEVPEDEPVEIIEESFSDYEKTDSPEKVVPADIEEIKKKVNDSFSVSGLNFSNLDGEN